jgi:hypothetical protein
MQTFGLHAVKNGARRKRKVTDRLFQAFLKNSTGGKSRDQLQVRSELLISTCAGQNNYPRNPFCSD